jgi:hypothetical protein
MTLVNTPPRPETDRVHGARRERQPGDEEITTSLHSRSPLRTTAVGDAGAIAVEYVLSEHPSPDGREHAAGSGTIRRPTRNRFEPV